MQAGASTRAAGGEIRDLFFRRIDYLRISVTDRCNLKCIYCMPAAGMKCMETDQILTTGEIVRFVRIARRNGLGKVRITGGEPLVRKDLIPLIGALKHIGIHDLSLTTNGMLLAGMARELKEAGLDRINVSLDTMDIQRYRKITRGGDIDRVWEGIAAAENAGLTPIKINMVPLRGVNDDEIKPFALLTRERDYHIRFIEFMPTRGNSWNALSCVRNGEVMEQVASLGTLEPLEFRGGGPSRNYRLAGAKGVIGFISPMSDHFCGSCNRLRLTANGKIRPCLFSDVEVDMKAALRSGISDEELDAVYRQAASSKPAGHALARGGSCPQDLASMSQIGG